jgi:hypothetical protein
MRHNIWLEKDLPEATIDTRRRPWSVRISLRIYFYYVRALDRCYPYTASRDRSATGLEVCNRSAHCEGMNGRLPPVLSTFLLLAAATMSAHGRAGATGSIRHKRERCNSDTRTPRIDYVGSSRPIVRSENTAYSGLPARSRLPMRKKLRYSKDLDLVYTQLGLQFRKI